MAKYSDEDMPSDSPDAATEGQSTEPALSEPAADAPPSPPDAVDPEAPTQPAPPATEPPKPAESKPADDPKWASRFAALSRQKSEVLEREQRLTQREAEIAARAAKAEEIEAALEDDEKFFALLEKRGYTADQIVARAKGVTDPSKLTAKALAPIEQKLAAIEAENKQLRERAEAAQKAHVESQFWAVAGDEAKYEAAHLVWDRDELIAKAHEVADKARTQGLGWGFLEVAQCLNEMAETTTKYQKIKAKLAQPVTTPAVKAAPEKNAQQGQQNTPATITNQLATERANGEARRLSHAERMARLMAREAS